MLIFNHRGQERGLQNISQEIDVRFNEDVDWEQSHIVLSHDLGVHYNYNLTSLWSYARQWLKNSDKNTMLAINIKEDGLAPYIKEELERCGVPKDRYFCFDMSQAEIQHYEKLDIPIATRISQYGIELPIGSYIWFDHFPEFDESPHTLLYDWNRYTGEKGIGHDLNDYKIIAISPELHGVKDMESIKFFWKFCIDKNFFGLCTDLTEEAEVFFNGANQDGIK